MTDCMIEPFLTLFLLTRSFCRLFSPRFSVTLFNLTSTAWEVDVFYCLGTIVDSCRAMLHIMDSRPGAGTTRANACRTFCRYIRYVHLCFTERQDTVGAEMTATEEAHLPILDTMQGLTQIFAMLSTTIMLHVIDSRQFADPQIPLSLREEREISKTQMEAQSLVRFLADKITLVKDDTGNEVSVATALGSYVNHHGRWLLWKHPDKRDQLRRSLLTIKILDSCVFKEEEVLEEWAGEAPDCFGPVDLLLALRFAPDSVKRKLVGNHIDQPSKRQRM
jgi:hypothetical protein